MLGQEPQDSGAPLDNGDDPVEEEDAGTLSSILAADAAIALSLLASRGVPPPQEASLPTPGFSQPPLAPKVAPRASPRSSPRAVQQLGPFFGAGTLYPSAPAPAPAPADADWARPGELPASDADDGEPPSSPQDDEQPGSPLLSVHEQPQRPAFRFIHPDPVGGPGSPSASAPGGPFADPAASAPPSPSHRSKSPVVGSPKAPVSPRPGPPLAVDSAGSNILFAVMNALCAPPSSQPPEMSCASGLPSSSASDARLVSGGDDGTVRVWRVGGGEPGHVMRGHKVRRRP